MKKIVIAALLSLVILGCTDHKQEEKTLLDSVIAIHDKVMSKDDQLMKNKMQLDTMLKTKLSGVDTAATKDQLMGLSVEVTNAEDAMETWMQKFDPESKGKSHQQYMSYLTVQKIQVAAIDSVVALAIKHSGDYLQTVKK